MNDYEPYEIKLVSVVFTERFYKFLWWSVKNFYWNNFYNNNYSIIILLFFTFLLKKKTYLGYIDEKERNAY